MQREFGADLHLEQVARGFLGRCEEYVSENSLQLRVLERQTVLRHLDVVPVKHSCYRRELHMVHCNQGKNWATLDSFCYFAISEQLFVEFKLKLQK